MRKPQVIEPMGFGEDPDFGIDGDDPLIIGGKDEG